MRAEIQTSFPPIEICCVHVAAWHGHASRETLQSDNRLGYSRGLVTEFVPRKKSSSVESLQFADLQVEEVVHEMFLQEERSKHGGNLEIKETLFFFLRDKHKSKLEQINSAFGDDKNSQGNLKFV